MPTPTVTPRRYSAPALEKGIDVIELLAGERDPLSLSAIAQALKRSKSGIFRVLHVLESRGYIERAAPSERYRLTNRMFLTGLRRAPVSELLDIAYPEMRRLSATIRQSCHISVLSGDRMITIARVEGPGEVSFMLRIGYGVPIHLSASGRLYLALLTEPERARWPEALKAIAPRLGLLRHRGFELAPSPVVVGVTDVSFPLRDVDGSVIACLAAPLLRRRGERRAQAAVIAAMRRTAERIDAGLSSSRGNPANRTEKQRQIQLASA